MGRGRSRGGDRRSVGSGRGKRRGRGTRYTRSNGETRGICQLPYKFNLFELFLKCNLTMKPIGDKCELIEEDGSLVDVATDERVDFHFNALLDAVADWRKHSEVDCSLGGK